MKMPRNKRESFIYSVIMCFTMVLWMSMYNVTLHMGHLSLETIREGWIGFPFAFVYAFLFDWFIVSGPAKGIAFRYFVSPVTVRFILSSFLSDMQTPPTL